MKTVNEKEIEYKKGLIHKKGDYTPFSGLLLEEHSNKNVKKQVEIKKGKYDGDYVECYESGELLQTSNYKDGVMEGESFVYYENGNIRQKFKMKKHKLVGQIEMYDEEGKLSSSAEYEDGILSGLWTEYDETGKIKRKAMISEESIELLEDEDEINEELVENDEEKIENNKEK